MPIVLEGFEVLRRIAAHADAFASARIEADKAARSIAVKCLKAKSVEHPMIRPPK